MGQRSIHAHFKSRLVSGVAVAATAAVATLALFSLTARAQSNGMTRYQNGILQYYGHGTWNSVDGGSTGVECSTPGGLRYNTTATRPEFCNGTTWRLMNIGSTVAGAASAGMTRYSAAGQFLVHNGTAWVIAGTAPMHRWKFDETSGTTVADVAPNPYNGTFSGGANVVSEPLAIDGTGLVFDGSNDFVTVTNTGNIFQTVPFTWSMWVKFDVYPSVAGEGKYFLRMGHLSSPWQSYLFYVENTNNKLRFLTLNSGATTFYTESPTAITTNTWYHVVGTLDSSFNAALYVNGALVATASPGSLYAGNDNIILGGNTGTVNNLDGRMDDVRFYNRVLTAGEISALYWEGWQSPQKIIAITSGSTWTVPSDWNSSNNSIEVIGAGGGGSSGSANVGVTGGGRFGGGGGAYSMAPNVSLTPGASVGINVGSGGSAGNAGGDTYVCNSTSNCASIGGTAVVAGAKGGGGGGVDATTGLGGAATSGVGSIKYSGGNGNGLDTSWGGGGGGGAAGPLGAGRNGGRNSQVSSCAGGGGGGANKGSVGANGDTNGGNGGNGPTGIGGATGAAGNGAAGYAGGGGAGGGTSPSNCTVGPTYTGGAGGSGVDFGIDGGAGGGGGGGSSVDDTWAGGNGGAGGNFGGGGGAGGSVFYSTGTVGTGGTGGGGLILIKYTPENTNGLTHHYKLDETTGTSIADSIASGTINGTFSGSANVTSEANSPVTTGVVFNGTSEQVSIPNTGNAFSTVPFTWSTWVKLDQLSSTKGTAQYIIRGPAAAAPENELLLLSVPTASDKFTVRLQNTGSFVAFSSNNAVTANRWYHVAVTVDSAYNGRLYVDGVLQNNYGNPGAFATPTGGVSLASASGSFFLDGRMDDVRFYNRALSAAEVKAIYDQNKPIQFIQQSNLATYGETSPHVTSFTSLPTAGNTVIVHWSSWDWGAVDLRDSGITDNHGNTYRMACKRSVIENGGADFYVTGIWYAKNIKLGAAGTFTINVQPTVNPEGLLRATEYSGLDPVNPHDQSATNYTGAANATVSSGTTPTTSTARQLLSAVSNVESTLTSLTTPTNWTDRGTVLNGTNPYGGIADRIVYSTGAYVADWTANPAAKSIGCAATFAQTTTSNTCPGGFISAGYCYYDGPLSTNCDNTCATYGKRCHLAGTQAASAADATCTGILTGLGRAPGAVTGGAYAYGCSIAQSSNAVRRHTTSTSVTCAASNASYNRVCACD